MSTRRIHHSIIFPLYTRCISTSMQKDFTVLGGSDDYFAVYTPVLLQIVLRYRKLALHSRVSSSRMLARSIVQLHSLFTVLTRIHIVHVSTTRTACALATQPGRNCIALLTLTRHEIRRFVSTCAFAIFAHRVSIILCVHRPFMFRITIYFGQLIEKIEKRENRIMEKRIVIVL